MAKVSLRAYNREIETMIDRNNLDEAVAHCQYILKTFPKHIETYRLLGKAYLEARRHNEAVDIFTRVLAAEPNDFVAHVGMSIIRDEQGKLDEAIWHMERAYEVQSANPAIQGELQRLYGRRDGMQPPRIRMTRGALAHMYIRGELYPQAISETKGILEEDQGRSDMQVLLAKAYYRSGQKKDAADAASVVLKRYPYCLDANLVLAEVLGTERPESAQVYRHRVVELDPYTAQVVENMFRANEVSDAAVSIDHLEWDGQPIGMSADWGTEQAISLESGIRDRNAQPDWLKESFPADEPSSLSALPFDSKQETSAAPAQPAEDIPDFLRAAGWGASTGSFDESKSSMFDDEPALSAEPIAQGNLPDWVKAMAPQDTAQPDGEQQEEEMPDWINKIGTDDLPIPSTESSVETDWLSGFGDVPSSSSSDEQPDWLKSSGEGEQPTAQSAGEELDWMKNLGEEGQPASETSDEQPDWMKGFEQEEQPSSTTEEQPDWMKGFNQEDERVASAQEEQPDWLYELGAESSAQHSSGDFDFLDELTSDTEEPVTSETPVAKVDTGSLGTSEEEQDDSFAWLENLAAKQGATEGLLTKPEDRLENEPDWIKQAKGLNQPEEKSVEEIVPEPEPKSQPTANVEDLGKSGDEIDDALAWFESLAAKQGATEGLLTKPEDRSDQEPEWIKKVKSSGNAQQPVRQQQPVDQTPVEEAAVPERESSQQIPPVSDMEEPEKSGQEIDDALAWFEGLAAKQGATEGLLTKPEDRSDQEPEWVKRQKDAAAQQPPAKKTPVDEENISETEPEVEEHAPGTDTVAWLKGLADEEEDRQVAPDGEELDTVAWLKTLDEPEEEPITLDSVADDLPSWMQSVSEGETAETESATLMEEAEAVDESQTPVEEPAPDEEIPSWLSGIEEEEQTPSIHVSEDLPAWMRDETGEAVAEPTRIEPTRSADWKPVGEKEEEAEVPPPFASEPASEPVVESKPEPKPEAKPAPKAKKPAPKKEEIKPAAPPEPYKEPVTRRGTGMLTMPVDPILGSARAELSRSNIPGALETYGKLIKKGRFLEEVIYDLREALYRYPVEVSIWQTLGDAYMRANQLQDALDAYTKAEELLR